MLPLRGRSLGDSRVYFEVFKGKWVANKGFATPNKGRVCIWPLVKIITQESLAIVEMS